MLNSTTLLPILVRHRPCGASLFLFFLATIKNDRISPERKGSPKNFTLHKNFW